MLVFYVVWLECFCIPRKVKGKFKLKPPKQSLITGKMYEEVLVIMASSALSFSCLESF